MMLPQNTSGETKVTVYKRIGQALCRTCLRLMQTCGGPYEGQMESYVVNWKKNQHILLIFHFRLTKTYRKHADRLQKTGEGVEDGEQESRERF